MIDWDKLVLGPVVGLFGESATYMPAVGQPYEITGIYDKQFLDVEIAGSMAVTIDSPVLGVRLSQFMAAPLQGDHLRINRTGETFIVREVRPDSHGGAKLLLNIG